MKASKHRHRNINSKRRTRKIKGGSGIGVKVESASQNQYINPSSGGSLCPGCRSDNTTAIGAYSLKTPLPDWPPSWNKGIMVGGGVGKRKGKGRRKKGVAALHVADADKYVTSHHFNFYKKVVVKLVEINPKGHAK